jgi:hypothetical protein
LSVELEKIVKFSIPEKIFFDCATIQDMADYIVAMPAHKLLENAERKRKKLSAHPKQDRKIAIPQFKRKTT